MSDWRNMAQYDYMIEWPSTPKLPCCICGDDSQWEEPRADGGMDYYCGGGPWCLRIDNRRVETVPSMPAAKAVEPEPEPEICKEQYFGIHCDCPRQHHRRWG